MVQQGDTLFEIAFKFNVSVEEIKAAYPGYCIDIEPGCYLVDEVGVLLDRVKQVVESVLDVRGSALQPVYAEDKRTAKSTGHERLDLSNEKAKTLLGWTAQTSVRDGIARLSAWLDSRG